MRFSVLLTTAALLAATGQVQAQYAGDALRFSLTQPGSTARFKGLGGAQTAVGGELSSVSGNPAGLGLFTRSEFSITPEFNNYKADARYLGQQTLGKKDQLNLNHAAAVWHLQAEKEKGESLEDGWIGYNLGIAYSRNNNLGNSIIYSGVNPGNSIADYFAELASNNYGRPNTLPSGTLERMAYDNYLIGYDNRDFYFPETDVNNNQIRNESRSGSQSEVNFAFGANYSNTLYLGFSLNIADINYTSDAEYREKGFNVTENNDYDLSFRQNQISKGSGVNGKLGIIYRPDPMFRIGASFETPTWYKIDDSYSEVLDTKYGKNSVDSQFVNDTQIYDFTYKLRTPLKLSGGIGVFLSQQGFISADIDFVDYSKINFSAADNANNDVIADNNRSILNNYKSTVNYRLGGELKLENLMLRAGYGVQGNPYKSLENSRFKTTTYSGGLGYRIKNYFIDLAYQNVVSNSNYKPYTLSDGSESTASVKNTRNNVFLTVGTRF